MGFTCMKCKEFTVHIQMMTRKATVKKGDSMSDWTKIGVCHDCYEKREKWCKSRGVKMK